MIIKAKVHRDGRARRSCRPSELVPGDVVSIEAGDIVPADGRLLQSATLEVAESALTGESVPVSKGIEPVAGEDVPLGDRTDMVFMNTNTTRGTGAFVVTATGMSTEVGHISGLLAGPGRAETPLTRQLAKLTTQILVIAGVAVAISMILNLSRGESFTTVFTAAIAFAVSAIPTGLPAVVTTILSLGTQMLAKANAIVKRLRSTETLGSTSAINSDKTGTLTLNQMTAVELTIPGRRYTISGQRLLDRGQDQAGRPASRTSRSSSSSCRCCSRPTRSSPTASSSATRPRARSWCWPRRAGSTPRTRGRVPARRRAAVRRRLQADGDVPPDAGRGRAATSSGASSRARPTSCSPASTIALDQDLAQVVDRRRLPRALHGRERAARRAGPARARDSAEGLRPGRRSTRTPTCCRSIDGLTLLALVGIVDPPRPQAKEAIADGEVGRDPGAHDHRRPRGHGRGDRAQARHRGPGDHGRRVRGDERRRGARRRSTASA